jgi:hypothetical protein
VCCLLLCLLCLRDVAHCLTMTSVDMCGRKALVYVYTAHPCGYRTEQDGRFFKLLFIQQTGLSYCAFIFCLFFYCST